MAALRSSNGWSMGHKIGIGSRPGQALRILSEPGMASPIRPRRVQRRVTQPARALALERRLMENLQYVGARNAAGHLFGEIIMSDAWSGASRLITLLSATVALGISACASEDSPTQPETAGDPA